LVDELAYPDEFRTGLDKLGDAASHDAQQVAFLDYARDSAPRLPRGRRIAVLFAQGAIVRGGGGSDPFASERLLGSGDMATELRALAEDDSVVAVVLRIDSPGGSALASDLILREVDLLGAEKPLVVSMSDVAASGGYYIAARASRIVAEPATITGSIGVVTGKLATGRFQEELRGVTHDPLQRRQRRPHHPAPFERQTARCAPRERDLRPLPDSTFQPASPTERCAAVAEGRV
jgi:protease-4